MRIPFVLALVFAACAGDSPPPTGNCTGLAYEPCNSEEDCDSLLCQNFMAEGFQVCSQACDDATPCPGDGVCDTGVTNTCKPAAPDDCELL